MRFTALVMLLALASHYGTAMPRMEVIDSSRLIRVLTYNILHGATMDGDFDLDQIANAIRRANPDLVALQEVDFFTNRAKKLDLVTELGWRLQMAPLFGRAMPYDGGEYGEGILSKFSFIQTRMVPLPHSPGTEPRTALEIVTILPSGDSITFVGTHLDHLADSKNRIAQAEAINENFQENRHPTILAGDLNAQPGSDPIKILEKKWRLTADQNDAKGTFPSSHPRIKIDYIMLLKNAKWKIHETKVIQDKEASDHCGYLVVLELLESRAKGE